MMEAALVIVSFGAAWLLDLTAARFIARSPSALAPLFPRLFAAVAYEAAVAAERATRYARSGDVIVT